MAHGIEDRLRAEIKEEIDREIVDAYNAVAKIVSNAVNKYGHMNMSLVDAVSIVMGGGEAIKRKEWVETVVEHRFDSAVRSMVHGAIERQRDGTELN